MRSKRKGIIADAATIVLVLIASALYIYKFYFGG